MRSGRKSFAVGRMHAQGIRSFILFPIYGLAATEYLSEAWFDAVGFALDYAAERAEWPSGSTTITTGPAAGLRPLRIPVDRPDLEVRRVRPAAPPESAAPGATVVFTPAAGQEYLFSAATDTAGHSRRIETRMEMRAGAKRWTWRNGQAAPVSIVHIVQGAFRRKYVANTGAPWTEKIPPADYVDLTLAEMGPEFVRRTNAQYERRFRHHFGQTLKGFFQDEPQINDVRMSAELQREFQARYGYALPEKLDRLFTDEQADRFQVRHDYYSLAGERFGRFLKYIKSWCDARGLDTTGHFEGEESPAQGARWDGDEYIARTSMSLPGMDLLCCESNYANTPSRAGLARRKPGAGYLLTVKLAAAAARATGSARILSESFGVMPFSVAPVDLTASTHWQTALGVNLINDNLLALSAESFRCSARSFHMPWWPFYGAFAKFAGRCCLMSTLGKLHAGIAVLYPALSARCLLRAVRDPAAPDADDVRLERMNLILRETAEALTRAHQEWELLFEEELAQSDVFTRGVKVMIIPAVFAMTAALVGQLKAFAAAGGRVLFLDALPEYDPAAGENIQSAIRDMMQTGAARLIGMPAPVDWQALRPVLDRAIGAAVPRRFTVAGQSADTVLAASRAAGPMEVLHVVNMSAAANAFTLLCPHERRREIWDPADGRIYAAECQDGCLALELAPWQGIFVVAGGGKSRRLPAFIRPSGLKAVSVLDGPWDITRESPNAAVLDAVLIHPVSGERVPLRGNILPFNMDPTRHAVLRFECRFDARHLPDDLGAVFSNSDWIKIALNGEALGRGQACALWDKSNVRYSLHPYARLGANVLSADLRVSEWFHPAGVYERGMIPDQPDPIVLTGDFSLQHDQGKISLRPPATTLAAGSWDTQGLAGYAGVVCYRRKFHLDFADPGLLLEIEDAHAAAEVKINGRRLGRLITPPFRLPAGAAIRAGENLLEIRVASTFAPWFGARKTAFSREVIPPRAGSMGPVTLKCPAGRVHGSRVHKQTAKHKPFKNVSCFKNCSG